MIKDDLGNRMKENYENVAKHKLTRRMPVIIRIDGCHFHTFTKGFKKPFDKIFAKSMQDTMKYLCENIQGCKLGYTQSDEISLLLTDYDTIETSAWFDYKVEKLCSVSASMATLAFNSAFALNIAEMTDDEEEFKKYAKKLYTATFDSRCFNIPKEEVANYFYWRQLDAERNSINSLGQSLFSQKELQGIGTWDLIDKILREKEVDWFKLSTTQKRGSCCAKNVDYFLPDGQKVKDNDKVTYKDKTGTLSIVGDYARLTWLIPNIDHPEISMLTSTGISIALKKKSYWTIDENIPRFIDDGIDDGRLYIDKLIGVEQR